MGCFIAPVGVVIVIAVVFLGVAITEFVICITFLLAAAGFRIGCECNRPILTVNRSTKNAGLLGNEYCFF